MKHEISAFDRTVRSLCDEIDYLKSAVKHWRTKYEEQLAENVQASRESLKQAQEGVASALLFALSVQENDNGDLVLPKDSRAELAQVFSDEKTTNKYISAPI